MSAFQIMYGETKVEAVPPKVEAVAPKVDLAPKVDPAPKVEAVPPKVDPAPKVEAVPPKVDPAPKIISNVTNSAGKTFGFIVLRHVNSRETNEYWKYSYQCIRRIYPEVEIIILDDNSNTLYVQCDFPLYKTRIVQSEFPGRGELLPYYYYSREKYFDMAILLHDSVFVKQPIDMNIQKFRMLWDIVHYYDQHTDERNMLSVYKNPDLISFHNDKSKWDGCFGCMMMIEHDFLVELNRQFDLAKLLPLVKTRYNRCSFERVIGCLCMYLHRSKDVLLGRIDLYMPWGLPFQEKDSVSALLPLVKVWTGR